MVGEGPALGSPDDHDLGGDGVTEHNHALDRKACHEIDQDVMRLVRRNKELKAELERLRDRVMA